MEVRGDNPENISPRPNGDHSGSSWIRKLIPHWPTSVWVIIVISIMVIALIIDVVVSRGGEGAALTKGTQPDASVFISTLILLYTVFVAAYGTLLPIVVAKERDAWERLAFGLIVIAIGLDLYRIANSLGDLYTTTMGQLSPGQIHDTNYEFIHYYFSINVAVIAVALFVASRRDRATGGGQLGSDRPEA
jgi:isoprenylcysteine carboxyl methyltransferase (ICMT) family protein YpbQ